MFLFNKSEHLQIVPTCKLLFQTWVTFISHLVHSEINFKPVKLVKNKNNDNNNKKQMAHSTRVKQIFLVCTSRKGTPSIE